MPESNLYEIIFLRHGESVANAQGYRQGQADFPMTDQGRVQVHSLAKRWQTEGLNFDHVISSPLSRARETADILTSALGLRYEVDPIWMERDNGKLAGLTHDEARQRYPRPDFIQLYQPIGVDGEDLWDLFMRGALAVHNLLQGPSGKILVVSHGGLLTQVMYAILGITPQPNFHGPHFRFGNSAFTTTQFNPENHRWRLVGHNDQSHLGISSYLPRKLPDNYYLLTLLRHGESEANAQGQLQGQSNSPLSKEGREQAKALAKRWKDEGRSFDMAVASPLSRARETGEIVCQATQTPLELDPDWMEQDVGDLSGSQYGEIFRGILPPALYQPYNQVGGTGESRWSSFLRASRGLQSVLQRPPGQYLIVAHGGILNMVMGALLGISPQTNMPPPGFHFGNAAFATLSFDPARHYWGVLRINDQTPMNSSTA